MSSVVERATGLGRGILVEWLPVAWMVSEAVVADIDGVFAHSVALLAFGTDSVIELIAEAAVLWRQPSPNSHSAKAGKAMINSRTAASGSIIFFISPLLWLVQPAPRMAVPW